MEKRMKVMVIVKATHTSESGAMPDTELIQAMTEFNEQLVQSGVLVSGDGLHPSSNGVRVRFSGKNRQVTHGPFTPPEALIAGFWIWNVESMEEAVEWVKRCPNPHPEDSEIEIRQVFSASDFGDALTPELREREASVAAQSLGLKAPRFENCPGRLVAGINASYAFESCSGIPAQWERFMRELPRIPRPIEGATYGVSWNYKPESGFDYLTGVEISDAQGLPAEFSQVQLLAQRYAIFTHQGHVSGLQTTMETIWHKWAPNCGLTLTEAPCFERYGPNFDPATCMGEVEIFLAIDD
jgi:predicted transcriptional regulator YdeE